MKNKTQRRFIILSTVLIVFILIYLLKDNFNTLFPVQSALVFPALKSEHISQLTLSQNSDTIVVYKRENQWYTKKGMVEYKADSDRIKSLIEALLHLSKDEVVSNNKDKQANRV